jgi:hypothetical protein
MIKKIKNVLRKIHNSEFFLSKINAENKISLYNFVISNEFNSNPDSILLNGYKVFSQFDEDGIIDYIFKEISTKTKTFVEIGSGNGLENNTHNLLLNGWRGVWIDGSIEKTDFAKNNLNPNYKKILSIQNEYINSHNIKNVVISGAKDLDINIKDLDLLSLDIDGYDYAVLKEIISFSKPRLLCLEYNPEIRPPHDVFVEEEGYSGWDGSHFHGASLQSLYNLLSKKGYSLVGCNASGYNSFFIKNEELTNTKLKSLTAEEAYQPPREYLIGIKFGHKSSFGFLNQVISRIST